MSIFGYIGVGLIILISLWDEKVILQFRFDTDMDKIITEYRPKDCQFFTAPLGYKNCRYEAVGTMRGELLYISWTKVWQ